ncbi:MAG TPA: ABC transporter permease [Acidimicrobiales bacterium]|nr:ABC transporter permease [Acidimicrobiales bacterium]
MSSRTTPALVNSGTSVNGQGPVEPPRETWYKHRVDLRYSLRKLWGRRDMIYTLAERDIRSNYKQAALGFGWAFINPVANLIIFSVIFSHVKNFKVPGVPYPIYMYCGLIIWGFFSGALASGSAAILQNLALMQKTHFPRACFPLSQVLEQIVYTTIAWIPLCLLFVIYQYLPHWQIVLFPILALIELLFTSGVTLFFCAAIVYIRDLNNLMGLLMQFGLFATPVIWPFTKIPVSWHGLPLRGIYSFMNPLGPVIDGFRNILLLGTFPDWTYLGIGAIGALLYFTLGFRIFERLEVGIADIA